MRSKRSPSSDPDVRPASRRAPAIACAAALLVLAPRLNAQADSSGAPRDTAALSSLPAGTGRESKKPWVAVGLSAALPGLGQIYNHTYWKAPVIWGLGAFWVSEWISLNNQYHDDRDAYAASIAKLPPDGDPQLQRLRDFYRDERDKFAWFIGGLYLLNLVDAYVGANLYDFDVSPDVGADGRISRRVSARLRIRM